MDTGQTYMEALIQEQMLDTEADRMQSYCRGNNWYEHYGRGWMNLGAPAFINRLYSEMDIGKWAS